MNRDQFDHVIRAAAAVVEEADIVVIGSQAILGSEPDAPEQLLRSIEVDVYPKQSPERAIEIDGALGDGSQFHATFGYYARGVGPETAVAPSGWQGRLVVIEVEGRAGSGQRVSAHCLEPHDLILAKCAAGRDRDWDFAGHALAAGVVELQTLLDRAADLPVSDARQARVRKRLRALDP
ncbi:MAG: hypothetical protein EDQ89_02925 [Acidobacteria bacterium]|nr:MAG: hypothetical protein EDQ89_02925 [Acidobacteriota bacterium]GIK76960.1 MAG: hypothetical protein BroJett022_06500 [Actinomycetes bacterium]